MKTIELVFFKGISKVSRIIRWATDSEFSHVAFKPNLEDDILIEAWGNSFFNLSWRYSSFKAHTPKTPYIIKYKKVPNKVYEYIFDLFDFMAKTKTPYDWGEILRFAIKKEKVKMNGKFVCSTGTAIVLQLAQERFNHPLINTSLPYYKLSPGRLFDILSDWDTSDLQEV